jgi:sugar phosphate isomerase/epimerase
VSARRFGLSTHLFHDHRLTRDHLTRIARHGFDAVEVVATRSHFDYRDDAAVDALATWLRDTRLDLHAVHAPTAEATRHGQAVGPYSTASGDETRRKAAVAEAGAVLAIVRRLPFRYLVVHLGVPASGAVPGDNQPAAARRSLEEIGELAAQAGVRVALEVIPNALSSPDALVRLLDDADGLDAGICLDFGHAHLGGDLGEAIETLSGHLVTTHVHDNRGRHDDHLPPGSGTIDWDAAMMATQKIGYDDVLLFEVAAGGDPDDVLRRTVAARTRLASTLVTF